MRKRFALLYVLLFVFFAGSVTSFPLIASAQVAKKVPKTVTVTLPIKPSFIKSKNGVACYYWVGKSGTSFWSFCYKLPTHAAATAPKA